MARSIPKARDGSLHQHTAEGTSLDPIRIGTAEWYSWLEQHRSFGFEARRMTFTARKEQRPGGWYWYAYRRSQGKLHSVYLGKSEELTLERLNTTAEALERGDALTGGTHQPLRVSGDKALRVHQASIIPLPTTLAVAEQLREPEPAPKHNLPVQLTPLIGREQDAASAVTLLRRPEARLLTMIGTAGIGKTRLALQVAADLLEDFADGVYFVSLAPISDPDLVLATIAQTLGLRVLGNESLAERLSGFLQKKHFLLVLDNFEQVMAAAPHLVELLTASPKLKLLVTSREVLHLRVEQQFPVPPLALPDLTHLPDSETLAQYPAVKLFIHRARAVRHDFQVTPANAAIIAEICTRLDGLPLALELAAARIKLLSPQALLARLDRRLQVLTGGARDLPERQRTLRATIEWSYDLLDAQEQRLFRRLAVFVGGCTLEATQAMCHALDNAETDVFEAVTSLIDKSFAQQREEANDEPRLLMLETVHEYAWEALAAHEEVEAVRQAHAAYYLRLAEEAEHGLISPEQEQWLERLEREHENLRAALAWLIEQSELETALHFATALWRFWSLHGHHREGYSILEHLLTAAGPGAVALRAKALIGAGVLTGELGQHVQAEALCKEGLQLFRELEDRQGMILSLWALGKIVHKKNQYATAHIWAEEALALSREMGDAWGMATSLETLTLLAVEEGRYEEGRALAEELLWRSKQAGNSRGVTVALMSLGEATFAVGDLVRGQEFLTECLVQTRAAGNVLLIAYILFPLGYTACLQGEYTTASALIEEGMMYAQKVGDREAYWWWHFGRALVAFGQGDYPEARTQLGESLTILSQWEYSYPFFVTTSLDLLGEVTAALGEPAWAARLWGAAQKVRRTDDIPPLLPVFRGNYEQYVTIVRERLGEEAFQAALAEGRAMTPEQALTARGSVTLPRSLASGPTVAPLTKSPRYPAGLTAREVEILRLVAQGMTDAQVAEQLIISRRTVNWHLTSIYSKLGVTSRNAASRYVIEHHLV